MKNGVIDVSGMIIGSVPIGERDRRVTLLTREIGKVSFFARGAARANSSLLGYTRLLAFGTFHLYRGHDSYSLEGAEIREYFEDISQDMERGLYAAYFMELSDYYSHELQAEPLLLKTLFYAVKALLKPELPHELTRRVLELKLMVIDGAYPPEPPVRTDTPCAYTWNYIVTAPPEKLFTFTVTDEAMKALAVNVDAAMERFMEREMRSLRILKEML